MKRNIIVGQSGGPTAAINSSLAGVYRTAIDRGANKVYGMLHGVQGLLNEQYLDLSDYIKTGNDIYIACISTDPEFKGEHIGRNIIKHIAKTNKNHTLTLHVLTGNTGAIHLYKKCGFIITEKQTGYAYNDKLPECYEMAMHVQ